MNAVPKRRLMKISDVMKEIGVSRATIWRAVVAGKLTCVKIGSLTRITAESYEAWLESLPRAMSD